MRRERTRLKRGDMVFVRGNSESIGINRQFNGYVCTSGILTENPNAHGFASVNLMSVGQRNCVTIRMNVYQSAVSKFG